MFHNISNPKWFGNWSRLEDDYLGNGGTDIADNFTFSKMEKTGGLFGSIIRLATAFPACDPKAVDDIRHGITPGSYDISVESHDCTSGRNALAADAPARDAPGKDNQNIG